MKILVVDSNELNCRSAVQQLGAGHDLQVESTFYRAADALHRRKFDVLMTDLYQPIDLFSHPWDSRKRWQGLINPSGLVLVLKALRNRIPYIGLSSSYSHWNDPTAGMLNFLGFAAATLNEREWQGEQGLFLLGNSRVLFSHGPFREEVWGLVTCEHCSGSSDCPVCHGKKKYDCAGSVGKDWARLLSTLVRAKVPTK